MTDKELAKKIRIRAGHRAHVSKLLAQSEDLIEQERPGLTEIERFIGQAENAGMVPRRGNLWDQVNLVNFGVLSSKIVGIQTMGGAFSLFFMI